MRKAFSKARRVQVLGLQIGGIGLHKAPHKCSKVRKENANIDSAVYYMESGRSAIDWWSTSPMEPSNLQASGRYAFLLIATLRRMDNRTIVRIKLASSVKVCFMSQREVHYGPQWGLTT